VTGWVRIVRRRHRQSVITNGIASSASPVSTSGDARGVVNTHPSRISFGWTFAWFFGRAFGEAARPSQLHAATGAIPVTGAADQASTS
jgi:hypothetical protein